jgi:pectate disaccharide-lyase
MKTGNFLKFSLGIIFLLSVVISCNIFTNDLKEYKENNDPNAFRSIELVPSSEPQGNMNRLAFGTSSSRSPNNHVAVNSDGSITLQSTNQSTPPNAGKIAGSEDGIVYYFKEVPANKNFKLSADAEVELFGSGQDLNGQEAWGLMARDYVPQYPRYTMNDLKNVGTNDNYYAGSTGGTGNMIMVGGVKRGVRVYWRRGVFDPTGGDAIVSDSVIADASKAEFFFVPREFPDYSIYPNLDARPDFPSVGTKYQLYLEKTNSGFRVEITPPAGKGGALNYVENPYDPQPAKPVEIGTGQKLVYFISEPDILFSIKKTHYYVGFFAARCARVKITNVRYQEADVSDCAPRIDRLPDIYSPSIDIISPATTAIADYTLYARSNVEGSVSVSLNGTRLKLPAAEGKKEGEGEWIVEKTNEVAVPFTQFAIPVNNLLEGDNIFQIAFYPDMKQAKSGYTLDSTKVLTKIFVVNKRTFSDTDGNIYVAPDGKRTNNGTRESPLNLETAIDYVQPGQKIIMLDGIYSPLSIVIPRNNSGKPNMEGRHPKNLSSYKNSDGTTNEYYKYYKILEAEHRDRAVIDFLGHPQNRGFELRGDYWILSGFHVRRTAPVKRKGITVMGNYNRIEWLKIYLNGDTGLQISGESSEPKKMWPSFNIVTHCDSFYNRDLARVDADGFASKLTVGEGNRFEWSAAFNNTDDGWDLFSKKESGVIGIVEIEYCIAYQAGYILEDWCLPDYPTNWNTVEGGNGNGFKIGGEGLAIRHHAQHCLSFRNKADGFTSNSNPALYLTNCTAFDNAYNPGRSGRNYAIYGSENGGSPVGLDARITQILSLYPDDGPKGGDDRVWWQTNDTTVGYVWRNGATQNKSGTTVTTGAHVINSDFPWDDSNVTGVNATFDNSVCGFIGGRFIPRNSDGTFKLNDFMKTKIQAISQPGATGLYQ